MEQTLGKAFLAESDHSQFLNASRTLVMVAFVKALQRALLAGYRLNFFRPVFSCLCNPKTD